MKREKKLWRRAVPAVAFGMSLSFAVLVHTPANADESYAAAESSEEANQITLTQGDTQAVAALAQSELSAAKLEQQGATDVASATYRAAYGLTAQESVRDRHRE